MHWALGSGTCLVRLLTRGIQPQALGEAGDGYRWEITVEYSHCTFKESGDLLQVLGGIQAMLNGKVGGKYRHCV